MKEFESNNFVLFFENIGRWCKQHEESASVIAVGLLMGLITLFAVLLSSISS